MIRDIIRELTATSIASLLEAGDLPQVEMPAFDIEHPQNEAHGDYSVNVAMKLASALRATGEKANPRALAEALAARIRETADVVPAYALIDQVQVAGPGFINFYLSPQWLLDQGAGVIAAGNTLGCLEIGRGQRINLEFVSANPTGPVTIGNGRGAFIGDTLGNVMRAAGFDVTKEYYFNDAGAQFLKLGRSMEYYLWLALGDEARVQRAYDALPATETKTRPAYGSTTTSSTSTAATANSGDEDAEELHDDADDTDAPNAASTHEALIEATQGPGTGGTRKQGYFGEYYATVAQRMLADGGRALLTTPDDERAANVGQAAARLIMDDIRETMARMHVEFDVWFSQASLERSGAVTEGIAALRELGFIAEHDGAVWAQTTQFGDDRDRVLVRSSGAPTYFASDVAYMRDKFNRRFDRLIFVLGPDHHGYIARLKAIAGVLGHALDDVHVLMYQQVNIKMGAKSVRMGKRLGNVVTLDELYEDIGPDVARFFYLMRANDTHLDFDLELARKQGEDNPGLSVQYAHARAAGVFRKALEQGITEAQWGNADLAVLAHDDNSEPHRERDRELALMRQLLRLEEVVERIALTLEPHHLTRYGMDLADAFHLFYDHCPILKQGAGVTPEVRAARLRLLRAAQAGLARTLTLLGMSAPERMEREDEAVTADSAR